MNRLWPVTNGLQCLYAPTCLVYFCKLYIIFLAIRSVHIEYWDSGVVDLENLFFQPFGARKVHYASSSAIISLFCRLSVSELFEGFLHCMLVAVFVFDI